MSFILDALRKVEKGKPKEENPVELDDIISNEKEEEGKKATPSPAITALFAFSVSLMVSWFVADKFTSIHVPPFPGTARKAEIVLPKPAVKGPIPKKAPDQLKEAVTDINSMQAVIPQDELPELDKLEEKTKPAVTPFDKKLGKSSKPANKKVKSKFANNDGLLTEEVKASYMPKMKPLAPKPYYDEFDDYDEPVTALMVLEGILYHKDIRKRTAMLRGRGTAGALVKVGGTYNGFRVTRIDMEKVTLLKGEKLLILKVE